MKNPSIYLYKFLISALLCTISIFAAAQENYKPMLVEGRSWLFRDNFCGPYDNWDKHQDYTLTVCGDTVYSGIKCKKLCLETSANGTLSFHMLIQGRISKKMVAYMVSSDTIEITKQRYC